jgi:hypothetical protein
MPLPEINQLTEKVLAMRAAKLALQLNANETSLFARINQALPAGERVRLAELIAEREKETLTAETQQKLIGLTDRLEEMQAECLAALAELAQVRGVTLPVVMQQLGIHFPDHD